MEMIQTAKRQRSESVANTTTNLSSLNDDCLLNLLNYFDLNELCTVGRVCKRLQQLVDMLFVTRFQCKIQSEVQITATFDRRIVIQPNEIYVKYFLKFMKRLRICDVHDELPFDTVVEFIRKNCSEQFDIIAFEEMKFHQFHGAMLGDWLSNVEELAFFNCKNLNKVLKHCINLKFLKIDQYSKDHSNKWMTKRYPSLQHLECDIIGLNKPFLNFLTNSNVKSLMIKLGHVGQQVTLNQRQFLDQLCRLKLEQLMISFDNARDLYLVKNQLKAICDGTQFKRLDVYLEHSTLLYGNMQELGFVFLQELKNLIGLHICSLLPTSIILEHVKVLQLTSVSVHNDLWQNLPNLEELYLSSTWDFQTLVTPFVRHAIKLKKIVARDFKITNRMETSNENLARYFNDQRVLLANACKLFIYFDSDVYDQYADLTKPNLPLVEIKRADFQIRKVVFQKPYLSNFEF